MSNKLKKGIKTLSASNKIKRNTTAVKNKISNEKNLQKKYPSLKSKANTIENFVSAELERYNQEISDSSEILYLKKDQLVTSNQDIQKFQENQIDMNMLKNMIREIVIEEIEKKGLKK